MSAEQEQEQEQTFKEQFIYPKNSLLRKSLQGIIYAILEHRRIVFRPEYLSMVILNHHGWIDDSNMDTDKPPGPNYRKAVNILKTFEGKFTKFSGSGLEIYIFRFDGIRIKSFGELEYLCGLDPDMSEGVATSVKLDLNQIWEDSYIEPGSEGDITKKRELDDLGVLEGVPFKKGNLDTIVKNKQNSFLKMSRGKIKGSNLSPEELDELKASVNKLMNGVFGVSND